MEVLLSKLHLISDMSSHGVQLTPEGRAAAEHVFPKILRRVCVTCPNSGRLTPPGLDGLVQHMLDVHPPLFWGWRTQAGGWWTMQG